MMKFLICIGTILICYSSTIELRESYDILKSPYDLDLFTTDDFDSEDGMDGYPAFRFQNSVTVNIDKLPLHNITLSSPFILNAVFKMDESESSCLFQLVDIHGSVKLGVCFTLAGPEVFYIDLFSESFPNKQIKFTFSGKFTAWTKLLLHVQDSRVTFYVNCAKIDTSEQNAGKIHFAEDSNLLLGHSGNGNKFFKGLIQEIKIYTNADEAKLENILFCQDVKLPDSTDTGDESDFVGEPESTSECPVVIKGEKGEKGDYGPSLMGPQGPAGPQGPTGSPGKRGEEGTCFCTESLFSNVLRKIPELKGIPGEPGPRGDTGNPGLIGLTGKQGDQGERGSPGLKGDRGERGDEGTPGKHGTDGLPGSKGEPGPNGLPGPQGLTGPPGPECKETDGAKESTQHSEKGDRSPIGPPGPPGQKGGIGNLGPKGEQGPLGERGDQGHPGPEGARGEKGERGEAGQDGLPGRPGDHGRPAAKGDKGSMGDKGDRGAPGLPMRLSALLDSEMEPKEMKVVEAILKDLLRSSVITQDAKGIKGDKGEPGKVGPRGPTGSIGKRGHAGPKGEKGNVGLQGPMGPPGKIITNEDLSKIKGDRGNEGKPGRPGPPGPPGPPGSPGTSVTGPKGEPGGIISRETFYSISNSPDRHIADDLTEDDDAYTAMTIVYRTTTALIKRTSTTPLGTLAYVLQERTLLLRVENGWQYVVMGSLVDPTPPYTTTTPRPYRRSVTEPTQGVSHPVQRASLERAYIRLAALNKPYSGRMHTFLNPTGRNAANYDCHRQSKKFGFDGNFVAFLANKVEDLRHLVKTKRDKDLPVVNIHGEQLFDSWYNMFNGSGAILAKSAANIYSFSRKNVLIDPTWPQKAVWHGGNSFGVRSPQAFCEEWQSDSPTNFGAASSLRNNMLLGQEMYPCDSELIVLCVEATALRKRQRHYKSRKRDSQSLDSSNWTPRTF